MLACALVVLVIVAGCGNSTETVTTTTSEAISAKPDDYINRGDAIHGFSDVLRKPDLSGRQLAHGRFQVPEGSCEYDRYETHMGWVIVCGSDDGTASTHLFTP